MVLPRAQHAVKAVRVVMLLRVVLCCAQMVHHMIELLL